MKNNDLVINYCDAFLIRIIIIFIIFINLYNFTLSPVHEYIFLNQNKKLLIRFYVPNNTT